jgi:phosphatidylserine decarboxylase
MFRLAKGHEKGTLVIITLIPIFMFYGLIYNYLLILVPLFSLLLCFHLYFFRDPERNIETDSNYIFAPADGTIYEIDHKKGIIRIRMTLFDVHVTRTPVSGKITSISNLNGKHWPFLPFIYRGTVENARQILHIENPIGIFFIIQIAGILARKCTSYLTSGEQVAQGERLGMIYYGSEVDIQFPQDRYEIIVKEKKKTTAGITQIAKLKKK